MLRINEKSTSTVDDVRISSYIKKYSRGHYLINRDLVECEIDRLDELFNDVKDPEIKKEIEQGIVYLLDLLDSSLKSSYLQSVWRVRNKQLVSLPFKFKDFHRIGVYTYMYMEKYDDFTIQVDLSQIRNAIAIQMCHRDMFYDTKELDSVLTHMGIGIKGIDSIDLLYDITLDNAYEEGCKLLVSDNPYISMDNNSIICRDYFGEILHTNRYKELLDVSFNKAAVIVLDNILNNLKNITNFSACFIGLMGDKLYFSSNMDNYSLEEVFLNPVSVRVLGRSFDVTPTIKKVQ